MQFIGHIYEIETEKIK